ncbi:DNA-binding transcriptional regulator, GntR family [Sulfitobacter marinus]|uniref:DNA-binding transcriptional regulator, GntR family n=1 Tax=Sulfitobacter marinus TaxID=394264 RepID=A0A1I6QHC2_9RHOB|nr:GntR family transcriptional regulator [Sulfitobacter marinus]SFS51871.1 DNA-binding transcriptional regulator, GntR family [Sulfitobacter marinus]
MLQSGEIQVNGIDVTAPAPHLPASTRVYEALRAQIISLAIPPGQRLSRPDLAQQFGVSASPLREAIQQLERDGLVATFRQSRTVVTSIDRGQLQREHFLRTAVECEVVNTLAAMKDKEPLNKVSAIVKMQRVLLEDHDQLDLFRKLDADFHQALFELAGQGTLYQFSSERTIQMTRLRNLDLPSEGKLESVVNLHDNIVETIRSGDRHAATDAMRTHLSGTIARLPDIMTQYSEYFSKEI